MTVSVDTHIILNKSAAKKDATLGEGAIVDIDDDSVAIWANGVANAELTQTLVGAFHKLHRFAYSGLKDGAVDAVSSIPLDGSDNDIAAAPPGAGEVGLYIGANITAPDASHFLDRTFKRLIERWLEISKTGQGASPA